MATAKVIHDNQIKEVDDKDVDIELLHPSHFVSSHINLIPLQNSVQAPRLFYGARFYNQALPLVKPEQPLVQNIDPDDPDGKSFDEKFGKDVGALHSTDDGEIANVDETNHLIHIKNDKGDVSKIPYYKEFPFNRKSSLTNTLLKKTGDRVSKGELIATSNYTDPKGVLALGLNARVGLVPYKGHSMDDAIVISDSFAKRLTSDHMETYDQEYDENTKGGLHHYISLFPTKYRKDQLKNFDSDGVIKPGSVLQPNDPYVLASKPKSMSSTSLQLGKLSKVMRQARSDASKFWDADEPGYVTDVVKNKDNVKVLISSQKPSKVGDKIVFRSGSKSIISKILPDDHMPRTMDGKPLEVLQNQLGLPSRVNSSLLYEMLLGKIADKNGAPIKVPAFNKDKEKWYDQVREQLDQNGLNDTEEVFDPLSNKKLERPITVGNAYMLKLHHISASKLSARGNEGYDNAQQPSRGGHEGAQAKRLSGLESAVMLSSGAYKNLKEASTLRGTRNDAYWSDLRKGLSPKNPGTPFVWDKFIALIQGAGMYAKNLGDGKLRLGPMTDKHLASYTPLEVKHGGSVDAESLEPIEGGLFDSALVGNNKWGKITLPHVMPNPAHEDSIRKLLGLTEAQFRAILAGEAEMPTGAQ